VLLSKVESSELIFDRGKTTVIVLATPVADRRVVAKLVVRAQVDGMALSGKLGWVAI
jgi:hypothetical protein